MADVENQTASSVTTGSAATPQSHAKKEKKAKNPRAKPSHPPTSEMVNNAIKGLKERGGSSLQAIKKFVAANYKVDAEKVAPFIKKYLKGAVASGSLVQTKGKGASGSFKLASSTSGNPLRPPHPRRKNHPPNVPPSRRLPTRLPRRQPKTSLPKAKKTAAEKKSAAAASAAAAKAKKSAASSAEKKTRAAPKPRSPSKAKKSNKAGPTKNPKHPNPRQPKPFLSR
ncbi:unnamed protein product [Tenebrio molitor]|nr:unnamed protein product [Tenebrio molitor]